MGGDITTLCGIHWSSCLTQDLEDSVDHSSSVNYYSDCQLPSDLKYACLHVTMQLISYLEFNLNFLQSMYLLVGQYFFSLLIVQEILDLARVILRFQDFFFVCDFLRVKYEIQFPMVKKAAFELLLCTLLVLLL